MRIFAGLAETIVYSKGQAPEDRLAGILQELGLSASEGWKEEDIAILTRSVNSVRLKNNLVSLEETAPESLYQRILS